MAMMIMMMKGKENAHGATGLQGWSFCSMGYQGVHNYYRCFSPEEILDNHRITIPSCTSLRQPIYTSVLVQGDNARLGKERLNEPKPRLEPGFADPKWFFFIAQTG